MCTSEKRKVYSKGSLRAAQVILVSNTKYLNPFIDLRGTIKWNMRASIRLKIYPPNVPVELSIFTHMKNTQPFDCDHLESPPPPPTPSDHKHNRTHQLHSICVWFTNGSINVPFISINYPGESFNFSTSTETLRGPSWCSQHLMNFRKNTHLNKVNKCTQKTHTYTSKHTSVAGSGIELHIDLSLARVYLRWVQY